MSPSPLEAHPGFLLIRVPNRNRRASGGETRASGRPCGQAVSLLLPTEASPQAGPYEIGVLRNGFGRGLPAAPRNAKERAGPRKGGRKRWGKEGKGSRDCRI